VVTTGYERDFINEAFDSEEGGEGFARSSNPEAQVATGHKYLVIRVEIRITALTDEESSLQSDRHGYNDVGVRRSDRHC
jgi:hypothetical protein